MNYEFYICITHNKTGLLVETGKDIFMDNSGKSIKLDTKLQCVNQSESQSVYF